MPVSLGSRRKVTFLLSAPIERRASMKSKLFFLPLAALAIAIVGCGGEGQGIVGIHNPRIRAVNDFSDLTAVSASVETVDLLTSQAFGAASAYAIVEDGNRDITFSDVSGATSLPLVTDNELLETEKYYTAIGTGSGVSGRLIILLEDTQIIESNMTRVRLVNANQDQANVDVYFTSTATPDLTGQTPQVNSLAFTDNSVYTSFTPGTYKMWVTADGSLTPLTSQNVTLTTNTVITFVVAESPGGGVTVQTLQDRPLPLGTP
jgi:hypothetical protein